MAAISIICPCCGKVCGSVKECERVYILCRRCGTQITVSTDGRMTKVSSSPFIPKIIRDSMTDGMTDTVRDTRAAE